MLPRLFSFVFLILGLGFTCAHAQVIPEPQILEPGKPIEREISGGQSHRYQTKLATGQFLRLVVEQQSIDVALALTGLDGRQLIESDLSAAVSTREPLSYEANAAGDYQIVIRANGAATLRGTYLVLMDLKAAAGEQDRKRIATEKLLIEAALMTRRNEFQPSIDKLQQALIIWRELGDRSWEGDTLSSVGSNYWSLWNFDKAVECFDKELTIRRELKDRRGEADTLNRLGAAYFQLNRYAKAIESYEQMLAVARELKDQFGIASALHQLGFQHIQIGRYEKAIEYLGQALVIRRELKDRPGEAQTLYRLGWAYSWLSRFEKAIEYIEQSLAVHREQKDRQGEADALNGLGIFNNRLNRYEKAIEFSQQALAISRELRYPFGIASALNNLGSAFSRLGRYEKAIEYMEQALKSARESKNRRAEATALRHLGNQYLLTGLYEKAVEYYEQALAINREVKWRQAEGVTLNNLAVAYANQKRYLEAIAHYQQALGIARELKNRINEGNVLTGLGTSYRSLGRLEESIRSHEQAVLIAREVKAKDKEADALDGLMRDWRARNQPRLAIYYGKQAVNIYQEIRSSIQGLDRELQQSFIQSNEEIYRGLADLLISEGRLPEAEQVIRLLKEEEYFDFIRRDQNNSPTAQKASLTPEESALEKRYREIADQLATLGAERSALMDKNKRTPEEEQRLAKLDADLVVAGNAFQKFLDQLATELGASSDASGRVFQLRESQGLMEDLRDLGKGTVALYTLVGADSYRVILTTAEFQKGYEYLIKASDLNRKVLEFREALQNPKYDPLPLARELYKILVGPAAKDLKAANAQTLMWSLDGVLRYVPVSALHDGKQYLVERYRNVVFTPASQARLKDSPARNWGALGLGVSKAHGENIPALPGVVDEVYGIIRDASAANAVPGYQKGVLPGVVKMDEQFTQDTMLTQLRQRPNVVHIASHFQFSPGNETKSALLLGDGTFLTLAQIKSLPNVFGGVDLLTLSACNTATGGSGANGKEVEGFAVLAQRQGAKAVVASLWPVADKSTKLLMQEFYRARESQAGMSKISSLREAQLKLLRGEITADTTQLASRQIAHEAAKPGEAGRQLFKRNPEAPFAHPYFWAPFILIGNWK